MAMLNNQMVTILTEPPFPILRSIEQKKGSVVLYHTHFLKRIFPFFWGAIERYNRVSENGV
jgi:hypothetical protein